MERIPLPKDAVGRLDLAPHPIVGAEAHRDHSREQRIEREDQKVRPELPQQEEWFEKDGGDGAKECSGQEDQPIKGQPQREGESGQEREHQSRRCVRAESDDQGEQHAHPQDPEERNLWRPERDSDRDHGAYRDPRGRPPCQETPPWGSERLGRSPDDRSLVHGGTRRVSEFDKRGNGHSRDTSIPALCADPATLVMCRITSHTNEGCGMFRLTLRTVWGVIALIMLATAGAKGQDAPRTPWGDPDLQGTYTNKTITPLERPAELADKEFLTDEEVATQEQARLDRNDQLLHAPPRRTVAGGSVGGYNNFWLDGGTRPTGRTSLIFDPPNGRMAPRTPDGAQRKSAHDQAFPVDGPFASWENLELNDRCLAWSAGPPMLPSAYNNHFMIMQAPGYVVILAEMNPRHPHHPDRWARTRSDDDAPVARRPSWPLGRRYARRRDDEHQADRGERGHRGWRPDVAPGGERPAGRHHHRATTACPTLLRAANGRQDDTITVTERFTRLDGDTVHYEFTVTDPTHWTQAFSGEFPFVTLPPNESLFEYACHEGNYSMPNILGGERMREKSAVSP